MITCMVRIRAQRLRNTAIVGPPSIIYVRVAPEAQAHARTHLKHGCGLSPFSSHSSHKHSPVLPPAESRDILGGPSKNAP